jgi:meso-butanediol dehydrogenase/(S,S)-butanediol dehydrogenase/diacetyl reductase
MSNRFAGKVVIVTGGGSGIGAAAALRFADEDATVVIAGRTKEKLDAVAEQDRHNRVAVRVVDVADEATVTELVDEVAQTYGRLDVLVNNAGLALQGRAEDTDTALWRQIMGVDLDAVFFASRAALPHLRATGGNIVNVSSVSGLGGDWGAVG